MELKSYLDIHSVDFSSTDLWTPVTNVKFHLNENQIIYFKLGAKKTTGCHDSFLFEIKGLDLISMMSVNYNHQWKINSYTFYDDRRMCIVNCQNTIVHAQERIKPAIKKKPIPISVIDLANRVAKDNKELLSFALELAEEAEKDGIISSSKDSLEEKDLDFVRNIMQIASLKMAAMEFKPSPETMKSIDLIIEESPKAVSDYKSGKISALGFLIGKFMKNHKAADANIIKKLIIEKLNETKN